MSEYKPRVRTTAMVLGTLFVVVLPAIWFSGMGYMRLLEHGLKLDMNAKPEGIVGSVVMLLTGLLIIPVMLSAILISGIPWMFFMSRVLSWPDIEFFMNRKGPRVPIVSDWLDRLWLRMIECKRPKAQRMD